MYEHWWNDPYFWKDVWKCVKYLLIALAYIVVCLAFS